jgi:hypothetical protein
VDTGERVRAGGGPVAGIAGERAHHDTVVEQCRIEWRLRL